MCLILLIDIEISKDNIAEDLKLLVLASLGDTVGINQLAIKFKKINGIYSWLRSCILIPSN